jgi:hypothetical protein
VAEVERPAQRGGERIEQQAEEAVVPRLCHLDPYGAEALAEDSGGLRKGVHALDAAERRRSSRHRQGEAEDLGRLLGPALELALGRQPVEGRVQLDGGQALRVEAEELLRPRVRRVEASFPGRIGEA